MKPIEERTLTVRDRSKLQACEQDIDKGGTLIVKALTVIRDERLYRDTHDTFEDYCVERWGMRRDYADKLIAHGKVLANLEAAFHTNCMEITEGATRQIRDLEPEEQVKVVDSVVKDGKKPTAKAVAEKKEELKSNGKIKGGITFDPEEIEAAGDGASEPPSIPPLMDALKREVPEALRESCSNSARGTAVGKTLDQARREVEALGGQPGWEFLSVQNVVHLLADAKRTVTECRFWTTCPRCDGEGCSFCDDNGYLPHKRKGTLSEDDKRKVGG